MPLRPLTNRVMSLDSLDPSGIWELNGRSDQWLSRLGPFAPAVEQLILLLQKAGPLDAGDPPNITTREYDLPTAILGPLTIVPEGYCTYHGADDDEAFAHLRASKHILRPVSAVERTGERAHEPLRGAFKNFAEGARTALSACFQEF